MLNCRLLKLNISEKKKLIDRLGRCSISYIPVDINRIRTINTIFFIVSLNIALGKHCCLLNTERITINDTYWYQ